MRIRSSPLAVVALGLLGWPTEAGAGSTVQTSYLAYRFEAEEGWRVTSLGDAGQTKLEENNWTVDFSSGAAWVGLAPPDRVLLGSVGQVRLLVRGSARGHPLHLFLRTHFMTFHKAIGEVVGDGEHAIVTAGPPGAGWEWNGGENDGRLHGPLRVSELRLEANGLNDQFSLKLVSITIEGSAPERRRCVMAARTVETYDAPQSQVAIRCLSEQPVRGDLSWTVRNWDQHTLARGERRITIPPGAQPIAAAVPLPRPQANVEFLETEFQLKIPGQQVPAVQTSWVRRRQPTKSASPDPEAPFAMVLHLDRQTENEMEGIAQMARDAGIKWTRQNFSWSRIEPQRGQFDWTHFDNLVACAQRNGISIYALVSGWAPWTTAYTDEGIEDYLVFLRQLVARYKDRIHHWEIWNEPNIFFWQGPKEMYGRLLIKSYAALKEVDASAQVLGLSTSEIDRKFISQVLEQNAPFDILTIHPYRKVLDDQAFINDLKNVSELVRRPDGRRRPVWITEMGWSSFTPHNALPQDFSPVTLRGQASSFRDLICAPWFLEWSGTSLGMIFGTMATNRCTSRTNWESSTATFTRNRHTMRWRR